MKQFFFIGLVISILCLTSSVFAQNNQSLTFPIPKLNVEVGTSQSGQDVAVTLQILLLMTILALAPSIVIMTTSYLRIIIVFHFLKNALGTQQMPPGQLLSGIALFITFFVMAPTWNEVNQKAIKPLMDKEISVEEAYNRGIEPIRNFMFKHVRDEDLELFISMANMERPNSRNDLPTYIIVPAFALSELRTGFIIGFFLFIPFLMVDLIISSILMSMGMMMLPPMLVSLPFKILLFILVDGWNLIVGSLVRSIVQ
ncbi:MAG: flagellar type III secretion system pore protein FliP [Ignavibacterium sp.]|nr:flagellar type III secretion system pore protein FliP [Ignavibacterium sp.]MCX7610618.1 flagellar type III secretion system pore protein FliP [Ignavibacterium sp.]MDW8374134.1 flagellar type III secretion system pore protein FliP [Ignavibacteriales bacterium]